MGDSIPFWGHFDVAEQLGQAAEQLEFGRKSGGRCALRIGVNPIDDLADGEVTRAFVCDIECVGDVEYIAAHGLSRIVRPMRYDNRPVMAGAIVGRTLVLAIEGAIERHRNRVAKVEYARIVVVNNPTALTAIFARDGAIVRSSEDSFEQITFGARVQFGIEDGKPVLIVRVPNGRVDVIEIDVAPARYVRLTTSRTRLQPVAGPTPAPAI